MLGFIGLGVMGDNLVLNLLDKGQKVLIYNRTRSKTDEFIKEHAHKNLSASSSLQSFCESLPSPRVIFLMIKAGEAVDQTIDQLIPFLDKGDLIVDGGNSFYKDSIRRYLRLKDISVNYLDCGVSGGAEGARLGPSMMVGGDEHAFSMVEPIFRQIAAQEPNLCMALVGPHGLGHFVKMVHNGIEYAQMQLIAESFQLLRKTHALPNEKISEIFNDFNNGRLSSYLMEIAAKVVNFKEGDDYLIDFILDVASEKGTGRWTSLTGLELGVPTSQITTALEARFISKSINRREKLNELLFGHQSNASVPPFDIDLLESSLYLSSLMCYVQGLELIRSYAKERDYDIDLASVTKIWRGGCIIRSRQLEVLAKIVSDDLFCSPQLTQIIKTELPKLEQIVALALTHRQPLPVFSSSLNAILMQSEVNSGASLIQGLRDFFGAHTYSRVDREGIFHTDWTSK